MPLTYDQHDSVVLEDFSQPDPTEQGWERYTNGAFRRVDAQGVYDPRTVWSAPHTSSRLLAHCIDDWLGGPVYCTTSGSPFILTRSYYSDSAKTILAATVVYSRNANQQCTSRVTTIYATDGVTVSAKSTDTYSFDANGFPNGFTRS